MVLRCSSVASKYAGSITGHAREARYKSSLVQHIRSNIYEAKARRHTTSPIESPLRRVLNGLNLNPRSIVYDLHRTLSHNRARPDQHVALGSANALNVRATSTRERQSPRPSSPIGKPSSGSGKSRLSLHELEKDKALKARLLLYCTRAPQNILENPG
jgi:hypothetical protein